jgi:hypothetical protein
MASMMFAPDHTCCGAPVQLQIAGYTMDFGIWEHNAPCQCAADVGTSMQSAAKHLTNGGFKRLNFAGVR